MSFERKEGHKSFLLVFIVYVLKTRAERADILIGAKRNINIDDTRLSCLIVLDL